MTARSFVTVAGLFLCCWLAATYLRAVPMDSYTPAPAASRAAVTDPTPVVASSEQEPAVRFISTQN